MRVVEEFTLVVSDPVMAAQHGDVSGFGLNQFGDYLLFGTCVLLVDILFYSHKLLSRYDPNTMEIHCRKEYNIERLSRRPKTPGRSKSSKKHTVDKLVDDVDTERRASKRRRRRLNSAHDEHSVCVPV